MYIYRNMYFIYIDTGRLCREIWTGWIDEPRPTVRVLTRPNARSFAWVTTAPCNATGLGRSGWKAAQQKRTWGCWSTAG